MQKSLPSQLIEPFVSRNLCRAKKANPQIPLLLCSREDTSLGPQPHAFSSAARGPFDHGGIPDALTSLTASLVTPQEAKWTLMVAFCLALPPEGYSQAHFRRFNRLFPEVLSRKACHIFDCADTLTMRQSPLYLVDAPCPTPTQNPSFSQHRSMLMAYRGVATRGWSTQQWNLCRGRLNARKLSRVPRNSPNFIGAHSQTNKPTTKKMHQKSRCPKITSKSAEDWCSKNSAD